MVGAEGVAIVELRFCAGLRCCMSNFLLGGAKGQNWFKPTYLEWGKTLADCMDL